MGLINVMVLPHALAWSSRLRILKLKDSALLEEPSHSPSFLALSFSLIYFLIYS